MFERKSEEGTEVGDDIERCVCMYVCARADAVICGKKTREERMARGLLGQVAKEEKIRDPYAEEEDNRRGTGRGRGQGTTTGNILKVDKASRREKERWEGGRKRGGGRER